MSVVFDKIVIYIICKGIGMKKFIIEKEYKGYTIAKYLKEVQDYSGRGIRNMKFILDNKESNITMGDIERRNAIAILLEDWGLLKIVKTQHQLAFKE